MSSIMREDWIEVELRVVCNIYPGIGFPKSKQGKKDGEFPFYKVGDISKNFKSGYRKLNTCDNYIDSGDIRNIESNLIPTNSVVFAKIGEALKLNRRCLTTVECLIDNNAIGLKAVDKLNDLYLFFFFLTIRLEDYSRATTVPSVRKTDIEEIPFPLPPLPIQRAIVSKIEALFSDLDNGIANFKKAQDQLKIYRQAVLKKAFEGGYSLNCDVCDSFDEDDLKNEIKKNHNNHTNQKNHSSDNLPKGWKWVKISEISNVVRGGSPRPAGDPKYYDGNIPFLKVRDITKDTGKYLTTFEYTIKEAGLHKTRQIKPNTLLLSNSGATLGVPKICMIGATMNDGIAAFLELDKRSNLYLYYFWLSKTKELRNINMGAAQPNLNTDIIKNYLVPYCSFEEQSQIVQEIESRLSVCDKMEQSINESIEKAAALRQSILKKAFEGKLLSQAEIELCKQAADYEPASELLKKIQAEKLAKEALRQAQGKKKPITKKKSKK